MIMNTTPKKDPELDMARLLHFHIHTFQKALFVLCPTFSVTISVLTYLNLYAKELKSLLKRDYNCLAI